MDAARPDDAGDGLAWATAKQTIQAAVDLTVSNDTVLVTNGVYATGESVAPGYACSNRVVITKDVIVQSVNGPAATIIQGQGPPGDSAVRCIYMSSGTLIGFTLTNGSTWTSGNYDYDCSGGGVSMYGGNGMASNCLISGNAAYSGGGTCYGTVINCMISGNSAEYGGGTFYGTVNNCTISGNSASSGGGGTYAGVINNCTINGNSANSGGGTYGGTVNNCTISGNSANGDGGGTHSSSVRNSIVWNNTAPLGSNYYNATLAYSCTIPLAPGTGNITNDPLLVNLSHINFSSPCLGAGSNGYATGWDIDGEPWRNPPAMGCDEVYPNGLTGALTVAISAPRTTNLVGAMLAFSALIYGHPASNHWSFGDGSAIANEIGVQHSWSATGQYWVIVAAFNVDNLTGVAATVGVMIVTLDQITSYVNMANPAPSYPYQTWATAATNIQDAVEAAEATEITGARVMVTNGTYAAGGRVTPGFACSNRVLITKDIIVQSVCGPAAA